MILRSLSLSCHSSWIPLCRIITSSYYLFLLPLLITSSQNCLFNPHATYPHYSTKRHNSGMDSCRTKVLHRFASDCGNRKHFTHFTGGQTLQTSSQNTEREHQSFRVHTFLVRVVLQQRTQPPLLQLSTGFEDIKLITLSDLKTTWHSLECSTHVYKMVLMHMIEERMWYQRFSLHG